MNQSTIYRRHEERLARTHALKDDPRPAPIRVLSGLPGFRMIVPPFRPHPAHSESSSTSTPHHDVDATSAAFSQQETIFSSSDENLTAKEPASSSSSPSPSSATTATPTTTLPQVVFAAAIGGGATQVLCGSPKVGVGVWPATRTTMTRRNNPFVGTSVQSAANGGGGISSGLLSFVASHHPSSCHSTTAATTNGTLPNGNKVFALTAAPPKSASVAAAASFAALLFGTKAATARKLDDSQSPLAISSACAGAAVATVYTPLQAIERHAATLLHQQQLGRLPSPSSVMKTTTLWQATKSLIGTRDIAKSLFREAPTIYGREVVGVTLLFGSYQTLQQSFHANNSADNTDEHPRQISHVMATICSGLVAGSLYRGFAYAVDSAAATTTRMVDNPLTCLRPSTAIVANAGSRAGLGTSLSSLQLLPTLVRTAPASAILFLMYEQTLLFLQSEHVQNH